MKRMKFETGDGLWFTSDHHFGHDKIIEPDYADRPFSSVEEMDDEMIRRWNTVVAPGDVVMYLGDFAVKSHKKRIAALLEQLHGHKHLIIGNHDHTDTRKAKGWASVEAYREITVGDLPIILSHYPFLTWNASHHGSWMLHGHCHGNLKTTHTARRCDIGVDAWDFAPVSLPELHEYMAMVRFVPVDHHDERGR